MIVLFFGCIANFFSNGGGVRHVIGARKHNTRCVKVIKILLTLSLPYPFENNLKFVLFSYIS